MTLQELFENPRFLLLPMRQRLLAIGLLALAEEGRGVAHPVYLRNKVFVAEGDEITPAEVESDLAAIEKALPVRFFEKGGERFYAWGRPGPAG